MAQNTRGMLLSLLIWAVMVAGVIFAAGKASATPQDDLEYFSMLENQGLVVTDRSAAKATGYAICNELAGGTHWKSIMATLMGGEPVWDFDTAATVFATAVVIYAPNSSQTSTAVNWHERPHVRNVLEGDTHQGHGVVCGF